MSDTTVVETSTESTAAEAPAKRTRGPRAPLTAGVIQQAYRLMKGNVAAVQEAMSEHPAEMQEKALAGLAKVNPELAEQLGFKVLPKTQCKVNDKRCVILGLAGFGFEPGDVLSIESDGTSVTLRKV